MNLSQVIRRALNDCNVIRQDGTTRATGISRQNGIWVNTSTQTMRYGAASTVSVTALTGTYVGTMRTTGTAGTTTLEFGGTTGAAGGDPGFIYIWNTYNRVDYSAYVYDTTDSWNYALTTVRASNNSTSNRVSFVRGLDEDIVTCFHPRVATVSVGDGSTGFVRQGIGLDSTSAFSTLSTIATNYVQPTGAALALNIYAQGSFMALPGLGFHYLQALEAASTTGTITIYGDGGASTLVRGGLIFKGAF